MIFDLISVLIIFLIYFFFFQKFEILSDDTSYSDHKKLGTSNNSPLIIGGIYLALGIFIFLPNNYFFLIL